MSQLKKIKRAWTDTIFVLNSNKKIIRVVHGWHGSKTTLAKDENVSDGCMKGYIHRALEHLTVKVRITSRKRYYVRRGDYLTYMANPIKKPYISRRINYAIIELSTMHNWDENDINHNHIPTHDYYGCLNITNIK